MFTEPVPAERSPIAGLDATRVSLSRDATIHYVQSRSPRALDDFDLDVRLGGGGRAARPIPPETAPIVCRTDNCTLDTCDICTRITCRPIPPARTPVVRPATRASPAIRLADHLRHVRHLRSDVRSDLSDVPTHLCRHVWSYLLPDVRSDVWRDVCRHLSSHLRRHVCRDLRADLRNVPGELRDHLRPDPAPTPAGRPAGLPARPASTYVRDRNADRRPGRCPARRAGARCCLYDAAVAIAVATDVAARASDPSLVAAANVAAARQTGYPRSVYWEPYGVAQGDAGLALLFSYLDRCRPGQGWDGVAHDHLASAVAGTPRGPGPGCLRACTAAWPVWRSWRGSCPAGAPATGGCWPACTKRCCRRAGRRPTIWSASTECRCGRSISSSASPASACTCSSPVRPTVQRPLSW